VTATTPLRQLVASTNTVVGEPDPDLIFRRRLSPAGVIKDLWTARELIRTVTERNLRVRYKRAFLGVAWAVLQPFALMIAFTLLHSVAHITVTVGAPYILYAYIGLVPWTFFTTSMTNTMSSVLSDMVLLNKAYFPREILPLAAVATCAVNSFIATFVLGGLMAYEHFGPASTTWMAIVPVTMLIALTIGVGMILGAMTIYVRDVRLGIPVILQFGLFATPIAYPFSRIPASIRMPYSFVNPVGPILDGIRRTVLLGQAPAWNYTGAAAITCFVALFGGYILFKRLELNFTDIA
jgi:ABC-2 type transport system permease protein/lipopolysaccharide transport system permease protein